MTEPLTYTKTFENAHFNKTCSTTQDLRKQSKHFLPTKESSKPSGRQTDQF